MADVLMEITKENLETGLRGYPVGYCTTSSVDPVKGLFYVGKPVDQMAEWDPERVIYLLMFGKEGSDAEVKAFSKDLQKRTKLSQKTIDAIYRLPREGHPMQLFSCALLIAGMFEKSDDYREDCFNVIAKIPLLVAHLINHHAGWKSGENRPELGYMENFSQLLGVPNANIKELTRAFRVFDVLHMDHGGGNLSTFTGKAVASGLADMWTSLAASMDALSGPRHGKANQDCLEFIEELIKTVGQNATVDQVEALLRKKLDNKELVFGFGHAVLRVEDPRATVFFALGEKHYPDHPLIKMAMMLRSAGTKVLKENPKVSDPYPNVDQISGSFLTASGFGYPDYFTVLFGLSRCIGIARQIVYERLEARDGKGTPIVRPKYIYKTLGELGDKASMIGSSSSAG